MAVQHLPRIAWITKADPRTNQSGEYIYTCGIIYELQRRGVDITVFFNATQSRCTPASPNITWAGYEHVQTNRFLNLMRLMPYHTVRHRNILLMSELIVANRIKSFNLVVIDSLAMGWSLTHIRRHLTNAKVLYLSHNYEIDLRLQIARSFRGTFFKRLALYQEACKINILEREIVRNSDFVSAITEHDARKYKTLTIEEKVVLVKPGKMWPEAPFHPPGRAGNVCIIGSFNWIAKQLNLRNFLNRNAPKLAAGRARLKIIGDAPNDFIAGIRAQFPFVDFTGKVDKIADCTGDCRLGLIIDEVGGGFKMKIFEYVENNIPILAIKGTMNGVPLIPGRHYIEVEADTDCADVIVDAMADDNLLVRMANESFALMSKYFRWDNTTDELVVKLSRVGIVV